VFSTSAGHAVDTAFTETQSAVQVPWIAHTFLQLLLNYKYSFYSARQGKLFGYFVCVLGRRTDVKHNVLCHKLLFLASHGIKALSFFSSTRHCASEINMQIG